MAIWTYVKNADPTSKVTAIELEGGLILSIGTYANLTNKQLEQVYASGFGIVLKEGIVEPATPAGGSTTSTATIVPSWEPFTLYGTNQVVAHEGVFYRAKIKFTSGETFNATNWEAGASGEAIPLSQKGAASGVATLNSSSELTAAQIPASLPTAASGGGISLWVKKTHYAVNDLIQNAGIVYLCKEAHESGETFSGVGSHWEYLAGGGTEFSCVKATENSTTDTENIKACLKTAGEGTHGVAAFNKPGVYHLKEELEWPNTASIFIGPQTVFLAVASMENMISDSKTNRKERQYIIGGGVLDSNNLAGHALWPRYFDHYLSIGVQCRNSLEDDLVLGDLTATSSSTEAILLPDFRVQRTAGSVPVGFGCVAVRWCSDGRAYGNTLTGQETGFKEEGGGSWRTFGIHPTGASFPMQVCVDDTNANWHQGLTIDTPTPKEHPEAAGTSASSTITDPAVLANHKGRPITGANIPAETFVGGVTVGEHFSLVNAKNESVKPTGNVAGITLLGVGSLHRGTSVNLDSPEIFISPTYGVDNGVVGTVVQPGVTIHGGNINNYTVLGGSESFRITKALMGNLEKISYRGLVQTFVVNEMYPSDLIAGAILESTSPNTPGLLANVHYAPESVGTKTTESTTVVAIDETNLKFSFIAPPSGIVKIRYEGFVTNSTSADHVIWLTLNEEKKQVGDAGCVSPSNTSGIRPLTCRVGGLTPGKTYEYYWGWAVSAGKGELLCFAQKTPWTSLGSPATIEVWAA